jgi:hypothetical protein
MMPRRSMRSFRTSLTAKDRQEKEKLHSYFSPLRKRLVLGTVIERLGGADNSKT